MGRLERLDERHFDIIKRRFNISESELREMYEKDDGRYDEFLDTLMYAEADANEKADELGDYTEEDKELIEVTDILFSDGDKEDYDEYMAVA